MPCHFEVHGGEISRPRTAVLESWTSIQPQRHERWRMDPRARGAFGMRLRDRCQRAWAAAVGIDEGAPTQTCSVSNSRTPRRSWNGESACGACGRVHGRDANSALLGLAAAGFGAAEAILALVREGACLAGPRAADTSTIRLQGACASRSGGHLGGGEAGANRAKLISKRCPGVISTSWAARPMIGSAQMRNARERHAGTFAGAHQHCASGSAGGQDGAPRRYRNDCSRRSS